MQKKLYKSLSHPATRKSKQKTEYKIQSKVGVVCIQVSSPSNFETQRTSWLWCLEFLVRDFGVRNGGVQKN
jgi:hypothetical protein